MKWIPIFEGGLQTDSAGVTHNFTDDELDAIVDEYNARDKEEASPAVLGHPETDDPAWAWVDKLKRVGNRIHATFRDIDESFKEAVNKRRFPNRSIALRNGGKSLRHVGFLGAALPAVKGLGMATFAEGEFSEYRCEFADEKADVVSRFFSAISDMMKDMPDFFADSDTDDESATNDNNNIDDDTNFEEGDMPDDKTFTQADMDAEKATFSSQLSAKDAEIAALTGKVTEQEKADRAVKFNAFLDGIEKEQGSELTPKSRNALCAFAEAISDLGEFEFAEGDETKKQQPLSMFKELLKTGLEFLETDEVATHDNAADTKKGTAGEKLTQFAQKIQKDNDGMTFTDAFTQACKDHTDLADEYQRTME